MKKFHLLAVLASRPEQVVSRDEIYDLVWGGLMPPNDRSVDVYVSKLRHKLETSLPHWSFVQTHIGFGYSFSPRPLWPRNPGAFHNFHREVTPSPRLRC